MNVEIRAEAALFPEKEYISGIFVAVCVLCTSVRYLLAETQQLPPPPAFGTLAAAVMPSTVRNQLHMQIRNQQTGILSGKNVSHNRDTSNSLRGHRQQQGCRQQRGHQQQQRHGR